MLQVMLIDQEFLFQKAFGKMMDDIRGCQLVGVAENGIQAMDMMKLYHPKVIFADAALGLENGISLCRKIKEKFPETVIYLLSNYCNFEIIKKSMYAGIKELLLKPLSRFKLSAILQEYHAEKVAIKTAPEEELFSAIEQRDYKKAYDLSEKMIDYIFTYVDEEQRKEKLEDVAFELFYLIPMMDVMQRNHYFQKYELTQKMLCKKRLCQFWLTQVVTEIFRQLCVMKYTHMNQAFQYIENNLNEELSLSALSEKAGISSGYLSRTFKKYYHISVVDYIHLRKLNMAKYYMSSTDMNISDISFLMGYSEAGYFCKIFKKYEGMTPSSYLTQIGREGA